MTREYPSTIAAPVVRELVVRKSRFITHAHPVASQEEAEAVIAEVRKQFWDARHNCVAMVTGQLGDQARSSDDGEPSGTAGMPMLDVLRRRNLTDVVTVVTRYFGGVLLGAGGLIRAYSTAVSETLDEAAIVRRVALTGVDIPVPHADAGRMDHVLRAWAARHDAVFDEPQYAAECMFTLWVREPDVSRLIDDVAAASAGAVTATPSETRVVDVP